MPATNDAPPICDYEGSTYRTDFWEGQGREYEDAVERIALRRLMPPSGRRLLDIGAGFGRLADMYDGYDQVVLLDYSYSQLRYARERLGDDRFVYVAADIYRLPLATHAVDTTVMVRVLHHLAEVPRAFEQLARVLRPQGTLVMEHANKRHIKAILRYLARRQDWSPFTPEPYEFAELHFDFHPGWVIEQLGAYSLDVDKRLSVSLLRSQSIKRILPTARAVSIDSLLQGIMAPLTPAPSVMLRARSAVSGAPEIVDAAHLFCCPTCGHEPLERGEGGMACAGCGAVWAIREGIYLFK